MKNVVFLVLFICNPVFSHAQEEETKCKMCKLIEIDKDSDENYFLLEFICNNKNYTLLSNKEWNKVKGDIPLKKRKSYCLNINQMVYYEYHKGNYNIDLIRVSIKLKRREIGGKDNPVHESPELNGLRVESKTRSKFYRSKQ